VKHWVKNGSTKHVTQNTIQTLNMLAGSGTNGDCITAKWVGSQFLAGIKGKLRELTKSGLLRTDITPND
jgi:hypothetical protein